MKIEFKNIIPNPLIDEEHNSVSVWGNDFTWETPQSLALYAVSGKGKSTFVDILSGVRNDFKGDLLIDSKSTKNFTLNDWSDVRKRQISTIYQDLQLFDNLSIIENIIVKNDLTNHFTIDKMISLVDKSGLSEQIDKKSNLLSFGQKQRVAIIRALAQPFELLILDEPFSHLDEANEKIMMGMIMEEIHANNAGFIITSLGNSPMCEIDNEINL